MLIRISVCVSDYKKSAVELREQKIENAKCFVKSTVDLECEYIAGIKKSLHERKVAELEDNVQEACNLASAIYEECRYQMSEKQLRRQVIKAVSSLASSSTCYRVLINGLDGRAIYNPNNPQFEGKSLLEIKDQTGSYFVQEELKILAERGEGFRYSTDLVTGELQMSYVKEFPEMNCYFVSVMYPSNYQEEFEEELVEKISTKTFGYNGNVFIIEPNGDIFQGKAYGGAESHYNLKTAAEPTSRAFYEQITAVLTENPSGDFMSYMWYSRGETKKEVVRLSPKISYVKLDLNTGWFIGAGFYESEVDLEAVSQKKILRADLIRYIFQVILFFAVMVMLTIYFFYRFERWFKEDFDFFVEFFRQSADRLTHINMEDMIFLEFQTLGAVVNEMILSREAVEKRLLDEHEKAEEADRLKSAFLANMSHEIRTPMYAIIGFSNFLVEDLSEEERIELVSLIQSNGESLLTLIDSIIDFSKIEVGQISLKENYVFYDKLCFKLSEKYNRRVEEEKLELKFVLQNRLPVRFMSITDEDRLMQVLKELLNNAFNYTKAGTVVLTVEQKVNMIRFEVTDTGLGIPEGEQERIFERFAQFRENQVNGTRGIGIGLTISARLVELLGGHLAVESKDGVGSSFSFAIPLIIS
ncbi:MAG: cache domain-containing protein [Mangrovibacterium sp.]